MNVVLGAAAAVAVVVVLFAHFYLFLLFFHSRFIHYIDWLDDCIGASYSLYSSIRSTIQCLEKLI